MGSIGWLLILYLKQLLLRNLLLQKLLTKANVIKMSNSDKSMDLPKIKQLDRTLIQHIVSEYAGVIKTDLIFCKLIIRHYQTAALAVIAIFSRRQKLDFCHFQKFQLRFYHL